MVVQDGGPTTPCGTVLIADDDDALRESFKIWIDDSWTVLEATTGREALEQLDESVDVLVLDRKMPELSGPEVFERLDETSFNGRVIVVSAYKQDARLSESEVAEYVTKPLHKETLIELLEQAAL